MREAVDAAVSLARTIRDDVAANLLPPAAGSPSATDRIVYMSLVKGTRGYIEQIAHQINGTYDNG